MNVIESALYSTLTGASGLTALLSGTAAVYNEIAPQGATMPYVVFGKQSNTPRYALASLAYENALYLVKGVTEGHSPAVAGSVDVQIRSALEDQALTVSGYKHMVTRRDSDVSYAEVVDGKVFRHRGALFRIQVDPS